MIDRRELIKGAIVALGLTTPAAQILETVTAARNFPRQLEFSEHLCNWGRKWSMSAKCKETGVRSPVFATLVPMDRRLPTWSDMDFAKRMIVQWFVEGGAERTLKNQLTGSHM